MVDKIEFSLIGMDSLLGKLYAVQDEARYKGARFALRKAAQFIRDEAKANARRIDDPETGRTIEANIAERFSPKYFKRTQNLMFRVGVLGGKIKLAEKGNPDTGAGGPTPHAMLVELGSEKARAQPYLRPALENNLNQVTDIFARQFERALDRAIKRAAKKAAK
jgi:HK97 gp10 family phage protein